MRHILAKHHHAIAKTFREHGESLDDAHEHKAFFHKLGKHHSELAKALEAGPDTLPDVGEEGMPEHAGFLDLPLTHDAGSLKPVDRAREAQELEKMFGGL